MGNQHFESAEPGSHDPLHLSDLGPEDQARAVELLQDVRLSVERLTPDQRRLYEEGTGSAQNSRRPDVRHGSTIDPKSEIWAGLSDDERNSILNGLANAEHTFRYMSPDAKAEAIRRHQESVKSFLGLGARFSSDTPRSEADRLAVAVADFVAHLHDDLPPGPSSELGSDNPQGLVELSEAEFHRLVAIGKAAVDQHMAASRTTSPDTSVS